MTAPAPHTAVTTELEIGCECADHDDGCGNPAEVWVIFHDLLEDCRKHPDGSVSMYLCTGCWAGFSKAVDELVRVASTGRFIACKGCRLQIRMRTDVILKVRPLGGVKR